jgi:diacylglycerol kinase family enzyme
MHTRLILNGKKADRTDVRAAVRAVRAAGHDLEVRVTWERGDAARLVADVDPRRQLSHCKSEEAASIFDILIVVGRRGKGHPQAVEARLTVGAQPRGRVAR